MSRTAEATAAEPQPTKALAGGAVAPTSSASPVPRFRAARYVGPAPGGGSASQFFEDEQGGKHLVKFQGNPQGLRTLINELTAGQIAAYLSVPCAEVGVIDVDQWLIDGSPELRRHVPDAKGGLHFAVRDVPGAYANPARTLIAQVENVAQFPVIIVFDTLTMNVDRNNAGNFLIQALPSGGTRFVAIDHGHCFGHTWDVTIAAKVGSNPPTFFPEMVPKIAGLAPFATSLALAVALTDGQLDHAVAGVPAEWALATNEGDALKTFLRTQRGELGGMFIKHKSLFPLWM